MRRSFFLFGASSLGMTLASGVGQARAAQSQPIDVLLGAGEAQPLDTATFTFNEKRYRGTFVRRADGKIVTTVPLEEYLYSVVPAEMPHTWPPAALQAQAICARSYALKRLSSRLDASESGQVYRGMEAETAATTAATNATAGQVLRYGGAPATVAYSSCCGGHTESASALWGGSPLPYLAGVTDEHCSDSPNFSWASSVSNAAVETAFGEQIASIREVATIRVASVDPSGRAQSIALGSSAGEVTVAGTEFRRALGTRVVRSLLLRDITVAGGGFSVAGRGLGHGVGLCQWGARGFALAGATQGQILALYFPGTYVAIN